MKRPLESRKPKAKWTVADVFRGVGKRSKYGNRKVTKNGETFDSVREYERHLVLLDRLKRGEIQELRRQPVYELKINGIVTGKYIGDWSYWEGNPPDRICEDAKGFQTAEFRLKWKIVQALYPRVTFRLS